MGSKQVVNEQERKVGRRATGHLRYEYVILAIPPSVWPDVQISADGKRMHPKNEIGMMGMAPAVKFFSDVKERFWIKEKAAPYGGSLKLGQVWEGTDNQTRTSKDTRPSRGTPRVKQGIVLSVFAGPILPGPRGPRVPTPDEFKKGLRELYPGYTSNRNKPLFQRLAQRALHQDRLRVTEDRPNLRDRPEAQQAVPRPAVLRRRTHADGLLRLHGGCVALG